MGRAPDDVGRVGLWHDDHDAFVLSADHVAVVLGIRWLIAQGKESRSDSALEILRQRYARGEINKEEFETKKET
jgi:uncharacterized membrane protein